VSAGALAGDPASAQGNGTAAAADPVQAVAWSFDPWSERPVVAGAALLAVLAMWLLLATLRLPWLFAVALGGFVASPLAPAFLPARCRLEARGVARRGVFGWTRREWRDVRRIDSVPAGLLVSPYVRRHALDETRGLVLPMSRADRDALAAVVRAHWTADSTHDR